MSKIDKSNKLNADPEAGAGFDIPPEVLEQAFADEKEAIQLDADWGELVEKEKRKA